MDIIYNILLILVSLLFLETLGNYISNKIFKRTFIINVPFGFVAYMAFFEILNFFPMLLHFSYTWVLYIVVPITLIVVIVTFYINGKKTIIDIKSKLKSKYYWLVILMSTLFGIYVMFNSVAASDSWLFMPMTLSGIQNGTIYLNDGHGNIAYSQSAHGADGYYLFQSMMASISRIDPYTYLMGPYRIIESFIVLSMFSISVEVIFKKYKFGLFLVISSSLFFALSLFTPYITQGEINFHFMVMSATGTQMLICVIIPMLFIYYYIRNNATNHFLFWIVIILGGLGFSSSSTYVICIFVFAIAILDAFYKKDTSVYKYYLIPVMVVIFYFYNIIALKSDVNNNYSLFLIMFICVGIIFYYIISKLNYNILKNIMIIILFSYVFIILKLFLNLDNTSQIIANVRFLEPFMSRFYPKIFASLATIVLLTLGTYRFYKKDKKIFMYLLVIFIFFANVIVFSTLGAIINQAVYHRVYTLLMLNVIILSGVVYLVEFIAKKWSFEKKYIWILIPLFFIAAYEIPHNYQYDNSISFLENKMVSSDLYDLYMYNYPNSNMLDISTVGSIGSIGYASSINKNEQVDQIYKLRSDLQYIEYCESDCYELYHKGTTPDGEVVLETNNYILVYKEEK